jgi:hypothetical protein
LQGFHGNLDLVKTAPLYCIAKVLLAAGQTSGSFSFLQIIAGGTRRAFIALLMTL